MSHSLSRLARRPITLTQLTIAALACTLLAGCVAAYVQPPSVDESKAKAQDTCQPAQGSDKTANKDCKKTDSK